MFLLCQSFNMLFQHAGVASIHMEFTSNENPYEAVYHSDYDSYYWMTHFGDPVNQMSLFL